MLILNDGNLFTLEKVLVQIQRCADSLLSDGYG